MKSSKIARSFIRSEERFRTALRENREIISIGRHMYLMAQLLTG